MKMKYFPSILILLATLEPLVAILAMLIYIVTGDNLLIDAIVKSKLQMLGNIFVYTWTLGLLCGYTTHLYFRNDNTSKISWFILFVLSNIVGMLIYWYSYILVNTNESSE